VAKRCWLNSQWTRYRTKVVELRPYQQAAVESTREAFSRGSKRVLYVLPTGGGKTVIFSWITTTMAAAGKRVCILVHRDRLVEQVSRSLTSFGVQHGIIAAGYTGTSDVVQVASVQTLSRRLTGKQAAFYRWYNFDLIIADEAHHVVAGSWDIVLGEFPAAWVLGVTATPARLDGKGLAKAFDTMVVGPAANELIADGYLVPAVTYAFDGIDTAGVHLRAGDFDKRELAAAVEKSKIYGCAITHYQKLASGVPAVAFCVNISHAERTATEFTKAGIPSISIDGKMDRAEQRRRIEALERGEISVLTSCDLISEGFDIPAIGCAILLRPTSSLGLYLQQGGRALRPAPGKTEAIILDHANNWKRHGEITDSREWRLSSGAAVAVAGEKPMALRTCRECYAVARSFEAVCPRCLTAFPVRERAEIEVVQGVELRRVSRVEKAAAERAAGKEYARTLTPEARQGMITGARSLGEMHRVARMLGETSGWAFVQWQNRVAAVSRHIAPVYNPATEAAF
jgi:DNA repair protein RadD